MGLYTSFLFSFKDVAIVNQRTYDPSQICQCLDFTRFPIHHIDDHFKSLTDLGM